MNADILRALRQKHQRQSGALYGDGSALQYANISGNAMANASGKLGDALTQAEEMQRAREEAEQKRALSKMEIALLEEKVREAQSRGKMYGAKADAASAKSEREAGDAERKRAADAVAKDPGRTEVGADEYDQNVAGMLAMGEAGATDAEARSAANQRTAARGDKAREQGLEDAKEGRAADKHGDARAKDEIEAAAGAMLSKFADADAEDRMDALDTYAADVAARTGVEERRARQLIEQEMRKQGEAAKDSELDRKIKRAGLRKKRGGGKKTKPLIKSPTTRKWLADTKTTIDALEKAVGTQRAGNVDTGEIKGWVIDPVRRFFGLPHEEREAIRNAFKLATTTIKKELLGANQTTQELRGLGQALPDPDSEPEVWIPAAMLFLDRLRATRDEVVRLEGADPSALYPDSAGGGRASIKDRLAEMKKNGASADELKAAYRQMKAGNG